MNDNANQTIITNGCLQIFYTNGESLADGASTTVKTYTEYLDIFLVFEGDITVNVFNEKQHLREGDVFFCTRSTYAEIDTGDKPFSYVRMRYIKDKVHCGAVRKRFAASILGSDIIRQKIFNHCLSFIEFFENSREQLPKEEATIVHEENIEILSILKIKIEQEHESLKIVPNAIIENSLIVDAVDLFEENIESDLKMQNITDQLNVSHSYFVRVFKRYVGVVPNVFWRTVKINNSLSLIAMEMSSFCDIAYRLGFSDQSHFTNAFKKYLQTTPGSVST